MRFLVVASILCASLFSCFYTATAQADDRWLIVPSTSTSNDGWIEPTATRVRTELLERGVEVWSPDRVAAQFESKGSAPATELSAGDIQAWADRSRKAIRDLAQGDYATALKQLNQAQALSRSAVEALNRDPERVQSVLDTCLYTVRALLETGSQSRAKATAQECRQLVPRGEPSPFMHPPAVTKLLSEIDAARARQTGVLRVDSEPSGCTARINGVALGETPLEFGGLFPGQYRVQVECDPEQHGRVHVATVRSGRVDMLVDLRFDRVVETRPTLHLRYESKPDEQQQRVADAQRVSEIAPASGLLLMSMPTPGMVELELLSGEPLARQSLARITAGSRGPSRGDIALAAHALAAGKCMDFTAAQPVAFRCDGSGEVEIVAVAAVDDDWPAGRRPRGQFISGLTLVGIGSVSLIVGYTLLAPRATAAESWARGVDAVGQDRTNQQTWLDLGNLSLAMGAIGSAALITAMPLALPERDKTPWWAWVSGGVGLGLAGFSIAYGVTAEAKPGTSCSDLVHTADSVRSCINRGERISLSVLTGLTAAPLITMPLVYLFRPSKARLEPSVEVGRSSGYVSLRGRF